MHVSTQTVAYPGKNDAEGKTSSKNPPENGRYPRGNAFPAVAVVIFLNTNADKIQPDIEGIMRIGKKTGAAISGTVPTANIGIEKIICNIVLNTNIRYLILGILGN
jgi:tetrahydromethanopterin S-methyltransferase subunit A